LADKTCDTRSAYVAVAVCARVRACKIARPREAPAKSQSRAPPGLRRICLAANYFAARESDYRVRVKGRSLCGDMLP